MKQASAPWEVPKMTSFTQLEMMSQSLFMIQLPPHSYLCLNQDQDSDNDTDIDDDDDRDSDRD